MQQSHETSIERLRNLAETGWLSQQPADFRERLGALGRWTQLRKGERLYTVGDEPDAVYGLGEGSLDLAIPITRDEEVTVHRAGPGFWIGESALLASNLRTISVIAASDCRLFKAPITAISRNLAANPQDWICFHRLTHMNGTLCISVLAEVLALPARARFARLLLRLVNADGSVRATQEELGRMAGMSRAAFRRAFGTLIKAGIVETAYAGLRIKDLPALEREAGDD